MRPEDEERIKNIPSVIKHMREHRGWTQSVLAKVVGISPGALHRIENGNGNMHLATLFKLADALWIDPAFLLGGDESATFAMLNLIRLSKERRELAEKVIDTLGELEELEPYAEKYMEIARFGRELEEQEKEEIIREAEKPLTEEQRAALEEDRLRRIKKAQG